MDFDNKVDNFFKNYHDSGMKKWGGFHVSEQLRKLNDGTSEHHNHLADELMTQSWAAHRTGRGDR